MVQGNVTLTLVLEQNNTATGGAGGKGGSGAADAGPVLTGGVYIGAGGSAGGGGAGGKGGTGGDFSGVGGDGSDGGNGAKGGHGGNAGNGGGGATGGVAAGGGIYVTGGTVILASDTSMNNSAVAGAGGARGPAPGGVGPGGEHGAAGTAGAGGVGASRRTSGTAPNGVAGNAGDAGTDGLAGSLGTEGAPGAVGTASSVNEFLASGTSTTQTLTLVITTPPPSPVGIGAGFTLTAAVENSAHQVVTSFNGDITVVLTGGPGGGVLAGSTTVHATSGVAEFAGLTLNTDGTGYQLEATSGGTNSAPVSVNVTGTPPPPPPPAPPAASATASAAPAPPPTIIREKPLLSQKLNKKHKPMGKAVLTGFELTFSTAMNPSTAGSPSNYQVEWTSTKIVKKKKKQIFHLLPITVKYTAATDTVDLLIKGTQAFASGGKITVNATPPGGVSSAGEVFLDGNNEGIAGDNGTFTISPKGRAVTRG